MIGTLLHNRYRIDSELGRGGMGAVYRAHDTLLERDVAIMGGVRRWLGVWPAWPNWLPCASGPRRRRACGARRRLSQNYILACGRTDAVNWSKCPA